MRTNNLLPLFMLFGSLNSCWYKSPNDGSSAETDNSISHSESNKSHDAVEPIIASADGISQSESIGSPDKEVPVVKIGNQIWAAKNLDTKYFNNGDPIPEAQTVTQWTNAVKSKTPAWCYYSGDSNMGLNFGVMYNWYAVNDSRGIWPSGFRIPSDSDFKELSNFIGGDGTFGYNLLSQREIESYNLSNSKSLSKPTQFEASFGGCRLPSGAFYDLGRRINYWTATASDGDSEYSKYTSISLKNGLYRSGWHRGHGYYVRCIKNSFE